MHSSRNSEPLSFGPAGSAGLPIDADLRDLVRIHTAAFPDGRGNDERRANFCGDPRGGCERLFVLRRAGRIVAHAFLFHMDVGVGGVLVPFGGIASVGVAPENRGQGLGGILLDGLHRRAEEEGLAGTFLYAFRQGFYRRYAYGRTSLRAIVDAHPASFPRLPRGQFGVRVAETDADFFELMALQKRAVLRGTLGHARPAGVWAIRRARAGREWLVAERGTAAVAYMEAERRCTEEHGPVTLTVRELVADDDDARAQLFDWMHAQKDQLANIVWEMPAGHVEALELVDPDRHRAGTGAIEHPLGTLALGPMVRLHADPGGFLRQRGWPHDGVVNVAIADGEGARCSSFALDVRDGRGSVSPLADGAEVHLAATAADFASLVAGGVALGDLRRIRRENSTALDLNAFFALAEASPTDAF